MPKRENPFGDSSPLQLKTHVTDKVVDSSTEENMQAVYEKTKTLLFEGSKNLSSETTTDETTEPTTVSPPEELPGQLHITAQGQLCNVGNDPGHTHENGEEASKPEEKEDIEDEKKEEEKEPESDCVMDGVDDDDEAEGNAFSILMKTGGSPCKHAQVEDGGDTDGASVCKMCNEQVTVTQPCAFCDRALCMTCVRLCVKCQGNFCRLCSVLNYEDSKEVAICLQCEE